VSLLTLAAKDFDESAHPRGEHGRFTDAGGAATTAELKPGDRVWSNGREATVVEVTNLAPGAGWARDSEHAWTQVTTRADDGSRETWQRHSADPPGLVRAVSERPGWVNESELIPARVFDQGRARPAGGLDADAKA